jgi:deoxyribose-phosphate aldolase
MTNRYTQEEWRGIIKQAERDLPSEHVQYEAVKLGSADFPKTIDHTLLKVDATKEQIDSLCNEARQHDFKARCWALVGHVREIAESNPSLYV